MAPCKPLNKKKFYTELQSLERQCKALTSDLRNLQRLESDLQHSLHNTRVRKLQCDQNLTQAKTRLKQLTDTTRKKVRRFVGFLKANLLKGERYSLAWKAARNAVVRNESTLGKYMI